MGLRINNNLAALRANRQMRLTTHAVEDSFAKLSSGERITKSSDDAAGLAISENLKGQIAGLKQAGRNAQNAISLVQIGEGALQEVSNNLIRMRELAIQAASDNVGENERGFIDLEYQELLNENQRIAETTRFGNVNLLTGEGDNLEFQVGLNNDDFQDRITYDAGLINASNDNLGVDGTGAAEKEDARAALENIDSAIQNIASFRAHMGSVQSRLNSTVTNTDVARENLGAANSRIRDADVAVETSRLASNVLKQSAAVAVQTQANNVNLLALKLIG